MRVFSRTHDDVVIREQDDSEMRTSNNFAMRTHDNLAMTTWEGSRGENTGLKIQICCCMIAALQSLLDRVVYFI